MTHTSNSNSFTSSTSNNDGYSNASQSQSQSHYKASESQAQADSVSSSNEINGAGTTPSPTSPSNPKNFSHETPSYIPIAPLPIFRGGSNECRAATSVKEVEIKCGFCGRGHEEKGCEVRERMRELWAKSKEEEEGKELVTVVSSVGRSGTRFHVKGKREGEDVKEAEEGGGGRIGGLEEDAVSMLEAPVLEEKA